MVAPDFALLSKANMIAHAAREIDCGLRDVFAPDALAKETLNSIPEFEKHGSGYFASILTAVGKDDPENNLAKKWFGIARNFHRIAYRKDIIVFLLIQQKLSSYGMNMKGVTCCSCKAFATPLTEAASRSKPSFAVIATEDKSIRSEIQEKMYKRSNAKRRWNLLGV